MYNKWGGTPAQIDGSLSDDDQSRSNMDIDRASVRSLDETQQSWLLGAGEQKKKKGIDLGCVVVSRRLCCIAVCVFIFFGFIAGLTVLLIKELPKSHKHSPAADNYTQALHKALLFFDAQKSGKLPKGYNISWRGDSGLRDGLDQTNGPPKDLSGGFYDAGDNIKFTFPTAFTMTLLSWSVIEYRDKYIAAKEYDHVRDIIKWGTDYLFKTFNYTVNSTSIPYIYSEVGSGVQASKTGNQANDHFCWERPETMDYKRPAFSVRQGSDLAGEMSAAMAAASIVFRDNPAYSKKCLIAAEALVSFAQDGGKRGRYSSGNIDTATFYNSSGYWDEFLWSNAWLYFASGNTSYLNRATTQGLAANAGAQNLRAKFYGVFSWDNKLLGTQILLTRLMLMQSPIYPYADVIAQYANETYHVLCSYLPQYKSWNRTKGGLAIFNYGQPAPLQYTVNAAFLASIFADYLTTSDIPVFQCGPSYMRSDVLKQFARTQMDYILGSNPLHMSYVVGFGKKYPQQVHHRAASIPYDKVKYSCTAGFKFRDANKPNIHVLNGAMVGGPDIHDQFVDRRDNYTYTEPTIAGNAGLTSALISLSEVTAQGVDRNTIFLNLPSPYVASPPPPPPWKPLT